MRTQISPLLIIVTGLPGTGKTFFARALAEKIGARHFNTDIIRDALGLRGRYDETSKQQVYQEMEQQTASALKSGERVVVDGTFFKKKLRAAYQRLGGKFGTQVHWIVVEAPEEIVRQRVSQKREYSEADFGVYLKIREAWEPLGAPHLTLRSEQLSHMLEKALDHLHLQNNSA